jgi:hypothetical protein
MRLNSTTNAPGFVQIVGLVPALAAVVFADTEAPGADEEALWQGDWDDEEPDDDFVSQLRAELAKTAASSSSSTA